MVANSMLAYASVNHLHYHFMCVAEPMLAARVVRQLLLFTYMYNDTLINIDLSVFFSKRIISILLEH